jgi:hypothetical protein
MFTMKKVVAALAPLAVAALGPVAVGGTAYASTGNSCETYSWGLNCINITGSGLHIDSMKGWIRNNSNLPINAVHLEYTYTTSGFSGKTVFIRNCPGWNVAPHSNSPNCVWAPNANEPNAYYCSTLWQLQAGGYADLSQRCAEVYS